MIKQYPSKRRTSTATTFSKNVRRILAQKDMTQKELADRLKVDRSQISHILNLRQVPTLDAVDRWAKALRVLPVELLTKNC